MARCGLQHGGGSGGGGGGARVEAGGRRVRGRAARPRATAVPEPVDKLGGWCARAMRWKSVYASKGAAGVKVHSWRKVASAGVAGLTLSGREL